jgi:hypothetical protein
MPLVTGNVNIFIPEDHRMVVVFMVELTSHGSEWDVSLYGLIDGYQCFGATCCLHLYVRRDVPNYMVSHPRRL